MSWWELGDQGGFLEEVMFKQRLGVSQKMRDSLGKGKSRGKKKPQNPNYWIFIWGPLYASHCAR